MNWITFLFVLKIIGLVLAGIASFALFLVILVLFVPITYRIYCNYEDHFEYFIKIYFVKVLPVSEKKSKKKRPHKKKKAKEQESTDEKKTSIKTIFKEITNDNNQYTFNQLLKAFLATIRHIGPRRVKADCDFGFDNPATTGYITGAISVCPFIYNDKVRIRPNFESENNYFTGFVDLKGHVQTIFLVVSAIRLLSDKRVRKTIRRFANK